MPRQDIRTTIAVIITAALLPIPAIAANAVQPSAAVRVKKDDRGQWLEFTRPIVQSKGDAKLSIIGIRHPRGSKNSEALELIISAQTPKRWALDSFTASDATGKPMNVRSGGWLTSDSPVMNIICERLPKGSKSLRDVKATLAPPKVEQELGTLTMEQLRYPCLLAGRIAVQMGDSTIATWPGHLVRRMYCEQDIPFAQVSDPTDKTRSLVLRLFTMYRPGDKWANELVKVIACDANGKELLEGAKSRLGGKLLPVEAARSYWGMSSTLAPAAQAKAAGVTRAVVVKEVDPFGPAATAGIKKGDVITRWAGKEIDSKGEWLTEALATVPGRPTQITVYRAGKAITLSATSVPNPEWAGIEEPAKASADWLHKKVGLESAAQFYMNCFVMDGYRDGEALPETFAPTELKFSVVAPPESVNPVEIEFQNIPIPAEFWK